MFYNGERLDERIKANDKACCLSHKKAVQYAKENKLEAVLIIEDDVRFKDDFDVLLNNAIENAPKDWDIIFLNGTFGNFNKPVKFDNNFWRVYEMYGAFGYVVNSKCYDEVINTLHRYSETMSADYIYSLLMKSLNIYRVAKPIIFHLPGYSYRAENTPKCYKHLEK